MVSGIHMIKILEDKILCFLPATDTIGYENMIIQTKNLKYKTIKINFLKLFSP